MGEYYRVRLSYQDSKRGWMDMIPLEIAPAGDRIVEPPKAKLYDLDGNLLATGVEEAEKFMMANKDRYKPETQAED